jgi:hypothetical protein
MRTIWLASAAFIIGTGIACAQTATPSPAPAGATSGPVQTSPGMSPGKETPPASAQPPETINGAGTSSAMPGTGTGNASSGMTNGTTGTTSADNTGMAPKHTAMMHHHDADMAMPTDGTPASYLHIAKDAIHHHNKMRADNALSDAETLLLTRSVPQTDATPVDHSPAVKSIEHARQAVRDGDMMTASTDIDHAMMQIHGAWQHHAMHHSMTNDAMGNGSMSNGSMSNGTMTNGKSQ